MRRWMVPLAAAVALGCSGKEGDSGGSAGPGGGSPYMNVLSPSQGQFIDEGTEVLLEVEGRESSGLEAPISEVVWTAEEVGWSFSGNAELVDDLPAGLYTISISAEVAGETVTDAVEVAVYAN